MNSRTQLLTLFLARPREAMRIILDNPPFGLITVIFLFSLVNIHIASGLIYSDVISSMGMYLTFGFIMKIAGFLLTFLVLVSLIHFSSEFIGTTASVSGLYALFMMSLTPFILSVPAVLVSSKFYSIIVFVLVIWTIVLQIKAVQENYRISAGKAIFVYVLPYFFLLMLLPLYLVLKLIVSLSIAL